MEVFFKVSMASSMCTYYFTCRGCLRVVRTLCVLFARGQECSEEGYQARGCGLPGGLGWSTGIRYLYDSLVGDYNGVSLSE